MVEILAGLSPLYDISSDTNVIELANYGRYCEFSVAANRVKAKQRATRPCLPVATLSPPGGVMTEPTSSLTVPENWRSCIRADHHGGSMKFIKFRSKIHIHLSSMPWDNQRGLIRLTSAITGTICSTTGLFTMARRTPLARDCDRGGQDRRLKLVNVLPLRRTPGERLLVLTVVQEFVGWLEEFGFKVGTQKIRVLSNPNKPDVSSEQSENVSYLERG
jgi:hypothetical protein